jgi:hypothetical protein
MGANWAAPESGKYFDTISPVTSGVRCNKIKPREPPLPIMNRRGCCRPEAPAMVTDHAGGYFCNWSTFAVEPWRP